MIRAAVAALLLLAAPAGADPVPEPDGYRLNNFRDAVPATLLDAPVLDDAGAEALWRAGAAFVDVFPKPPRPAGLPEDTLWIDPRRTTIEGAIWLPNTGFGVITPDTDAYFRAHLARLTEGDTARPVVIFCLADCWMSWNAARRAILEYGYTGVAWYPRGTDGWDEAGLPMRTVSAAPAPE